MLVNATDVKNNFGYYLSLLKQEDVIILRNGKPVARLSPQTGWQEGLRLGEEPAEYGVPDDGGGNETPDEHDGKPMAYHQFIKMHEHTDKRYEFIDGKVWLMSAPSEEHQRIIGNLFIIFHTFLRGKSCRAYLSPLDVHLGCRLSDHNIVQPDLLVVYDQSLFNEKGCYVGVPSVTVEVMSPSSRSQDLIRKMSLYLRSGVQEYWTVDAANHLISIYRFKENQIVLQSSFDIDRQVRSDYLQGLVFPAASVYD
ncbi:MAG: type II toxin-antitoxin system Phd/YefM family antitoxin [Clostridiaceae bacterium]|nr:type II toxin-antitoxin system Phd/YefM family antitoxin [Clostridiaceae bacterium]